MPLQVTGTGNLGADPETRYTASGKETLTMRIAVTPRRQNQNTGQWEDVGTPLWVSATFWEHAARNLSQAGLRKGDRVGVSGTLSQREYTRRDGTSGVSLELLNPTFLGVTPRLGAHMGGGPQQDNPWGQQPQQPQQAQPVQQSTQNVQMTNTTSVGNDPWAQPALDEEPPF